MPLGAWADSYFAINTSTGSYWVTDENATNILGDGKMSYDITNNVLTLDGIDLAFTSDYFSDAFIAMVDPDHPSIMVHLIGHNTLTLGDKASVFNGTSITFTAENADASLTIDTEDGWAGGLFLDSQSAITPTYRDNLGYYSSSSEIKYAEPYLLWIGETQVTAANKDDLAAANSNIKVGNATFDPTTNTLYMNSIQTKDCIKSELENLTINLEGANRIGYIANQDDNPAIYSEETNGTLTLTKTGTHASLYVESMMVTSAIFGFSSFDYSLFSVNPSENTSYNTELGLNNGEYGIEKATFYTGSLYPIWVGETQVTSANLSDIKDDNISEGTVSYDPETNTLTLDNVIADMGNDAPHFIESTVQNLKVKLYDYNKVTLDGEMYGDQICFVKQTGAWTTSTLTFDTGWKNDGYNEVLGQLFIEGSTDETIVAQDYSVSNTFEVTAIYLDPEEAGNATTGWKRGIHEKDPNNNSPDPDYVKIWYLEVYDLWIGSGRVLSSALEAGQSGAPIYNPVNNTLDYNSTNSFPIKSSLPELKISVNGSACGINYESPSTAAITFQATDQQTTGTLKFVVPEEAASNPINKFTVNCELGVISGFSSVTIEEPLALRTPATAPETWGASTTQVVISTFDDSNLFGGGDGSEESPYEISTPQELFLFTQKYNANELSSLSCYVELGDDIDCTGLQGFTPIGSTPQHPFVGTFDGKGKKIIGLSFDADKKDDYVGLFHKVGDDGDEPAPGYVSNLTLENCTFENGKMYNGAIAGILNKGTIDNCTVTSCNILSESSQPSSGGIVGGLFGGSITNCTVSGSTITATSGAGGLAGGIVAYAYGSDNGSDNGSATVSGCQVTGTATNPTTITSSSNYGGDQGDNPTGGIVGYCYCGDEYPIIISNNKVSGNTTISSIDYYVDTNNFTCAGAIVGEKGKASFSNNYYYYSVTTSTKNGDEEAVERSGYQQRGTGYSSYDEQLQVVTEDYDIVTDNGAMLYTKLVTFNIDTHCGMECDWGYELLSEPDNRLYYFAPGQPIIVNLYPDDGYIIEAVTLTYTAEGATAATVETLENDDSGNDEMNYTYTFTMPDAPASFDVTVNQALDIEFVDDNSWASYYATENLTVPTGLTAYVVSDVDEESGAVTVTSIGYIPKNNAVLLEREQNGAASGYTAGAYTGTTTTVNNLLSGSPNTTDISSLGSGPVYVLFNDKFKRAISGTIPARRAYLALDAAVAPVSAPQYLTINIVDGNSTAIDTLTVDDSSNDSWYTIDGLKLKGKPQRKGLYINNGKKVYINNNK